MSDTSNTKTENTRLRILITVMAGILSVFLYYEILNVIQYQTSMVQARKEMEDAAKWLETSYPGAQEPFNIIDSSARNLYDEDMTLLMTDTVRIPPSPATAARISSSAPNHAAGSTA